jgi:transposase
MSGARAEKLPDLPPVPAGSAVRTVSPSGAISRSELRRMLEQGWTLASCAGHFGVSVSAVRQYAARWGMAAEVPERGVIDLDRLHEMRRQGMSVRACAAALGVGDSAVRKRLVPFDPGPRSRPGRPRDPEAAARSAKMRALARQGKTYREIAEATGYSESHVAKLVTGWKQTGELWADAPARRSPPPPPPPPPAAPPGWSVDRDAAVLATKGRYAKLAALAARWGEPMQRVHARWHRLRAAR